MPRGKRGSKVESSLKAEPSDPRLSQDVLSIAVLLICNLTPFYGVIFLGWSITQLLVLYYLEALVMLVLAVARIFLHAEGRTHARRLKDVKGLLATVVVWPLYFPFLLFINAELLS